MIKVTKKGNYQIFHRNSNEILVLDKRLAFTWKKKAAGKSMLTPCDLHSEMKQMITTGTYRLYEVRGDKKITDGIHLELFLGNGKWQGYIVSKKLGKMLDEAIISTTDDLISKSVHFFPVGVSLL